MTLNEAGVKIRENLTDDLRKPEYQGHSNKYRGHCYVASEALYHLAAKKMGYKPAIVKVEGETHWFLRKKEDYEYLVIDLTKRQYPMLFIDYSKARGCGFLTKGPSKRAQKLMERVFK